MVGENLYLAITEMQALEALRVYELSNETDILICFDILYLMNSISKDIHSHVDSASNQNWGTEILALSKSLESDLLTESSWFTVFCRDNISWTLEHCKESFFRTEMESFMEIPNFSNTKKSNSKNTLSSISPWLHLILNFLPNDFKNALNFKTVEECTIVFNKLFNSLNETNLGHFKAALRILFQNESLLIDEANYDDISLKEQSIETLAASVFADIFAQKIMAASNTFHKHEIPIIKDLSVGLISQVCTIKNYLFFFF